MNVNVLQWEDWLYLEKGGRLLELVVLRNTFANSILHIGEKSVFRDQTIPIASIIEIQDVLGQLGAICDCLDRNQGL